MAHLFIKYHSGDTGARGMSIPNCGSQPPWPWLSPSITLTLPNGAPLSKARVGQPCIINVHVDTKEGPFPFVSPHVKVQVWVCDYTLGVGPQSVRQYTSGYFTEAGKTASVLTDITTSAHGTVSIPWTPVSGDLRNFNPDTREAHMCIGANTYWEGDPPPPEPGPMPPPNVLDICGNQHHGQLNIAIEPMGDEESVLMVDVHNFGGAGDIYRVDVRETPGSLGIVERAQILGERFATLVGGRVDWRRLVRRRPPGEGMPVEPLAHLALRAGGKLVMARGQVPLRVSRKPLGLLELSADPEAGTDLRMRVPPGRRPKTIELRAAFAPDEPVGAVKVVDLIQRTQRGRVIGGGRVIFVKARKG